MKKLLPLIAILLAISVLTTTASASFFDFLYSPKVTPFVPISKEEQWLSLSQNLDNLNTPVNIEKLQTLLSSYNYKDATFIIEVTDLKKAFILDYNAGAITSFNGGAYDITYVIKLPSSKVNTIIDILNNDSFSLHSFSPLTKIRLYLELAHS
jgi:hypothetical protein